MKTIQEINTEISTLTKEHSSLSDYIPSEEKLKNKARKRIQMLRKCILFLETNPRAEFVSEMLQETQRKVKIYQDRLKNYESSVPASLVEKIANLKAYYYKEVAPNEKKEIKDAKIQQEIINYLLV